MIYDDLAEYFTEYQYEWNFDGVYKIPTAEDIEGAVDKAISVLYPEPEGSLLEVGRLIIQKSANKTYDIYFHIGVTK